MVESLQKLVNNNTKIKSKTKLFFPSATEQTEY